MSEEATATAEQTLSEAVKTITVDNREVPITEAQKTFSDMEKSLRADVTRKLQTVATEKQQTAAALKADKEWYTNNDMRLWDMYQPIIDGGAGFVGTEAQLHQFDNEPESTYSEESHVPKRKPMETDPVVQNLLNKISYLEKKVEGIEGSNFATEKERVLKTKDELLKKYDKAGERAVLKELGLFFNENGGRHPTKGEIEDIVKAHHEENSKIFARTAKGKEETGIPQKPVTATPSGKGEPPTTGKTKGVAHFDHDGLVKRVFQKMSG